MNVSSCSPGLGEDPTYLFLSFPFPPPPHSRGRPHSGFGVVGKHERRDVSKVFDLKEPPKLERDSEFSEP